MANEKTFVLVKPNGVERGLVGEVVRRFEERGLQLRGLKLLKASKKLAREHYIEHKDRPFYGEVVDFITRSPVAAMVLEGESAVSVVRTMMGATNPVDAAPGTIRGDFATDMGENVVHGSDSVASAKREISLYFDKSELVKPAK